ncbi:MAG: M23 family metallopeptidase [Deltaproteobacteria bacterium]|nr:M23 family metallopeptidase [Deltaproteobacteria bacterium]
MKNNRMGLLDRLRTLEEANINIKKEEPQLSSAVLNQVKAMTYQWQWPVRPVVITSLFGKRGSDYHEGVDLRAKRGSIVYAVSDGEVIYAGASIKGYGKMLVIEHGGVGGNALSTVYAHNSRLVVKKGQRVRKGQQIAYSGSTGHSVGPHLHFEIRHGVIALDPIKILPEHPNWASQVIATRKK